MHVLVIYLELHIPAAQSLKAKRSVITSLVRQIDQIHGVAAAEVHHLDVWQRAGLGVSIVGGTVTHVEQVADTVERKVWSRTDADVITTERSWWDNSALSDY